jgi:hypothetical protein
LKSNSKSPKFIPEAKYLKKIRKVHSFVSAKELMKKWKAIRDNFVRCHRKITQTETGKAANNKKVYLFYNQLQFLLPYAKGSTNTSSNISAPAGTQNGAEGSQDTLDQTANSNEEDSKIDIDATASPSTGTNIAPSPSKKKRKNIHKYASNKRAANEQSIASSAKELTSILTQSLAIQREQAYQDKERQADVYGHQAFLLSFVPAFNSMPLHVAMEARLKIAEVVNASLHKSCMNLSTSTGHHSASAGWSTSGCSTPAPSTPLNTDSNSEDFNIADYIRLDNAVQNM